MSTLSQDTRGQELELKKWASAQKGDVVWIRDKLTGTSIERPGLEKLLAQVRAGLIKKVVVWRLDRLGPTAKGLYQLFEEFLALKVGFVSLRYGLDLTTPAGRLMAGVLASVAQHETEVRRGRQQAGISKARALHCGRCPWGGRKKGSRVKITEEKEAAKEAMKQFEQQRRARLA